MNKASMRLGGSSRSRRMALCLDLIFALMCALALIPAVHTTGDLIWPHDTALYRDLAIAQSMQDGPYLADPVYLGEMLWYNPLVPTLVAGISWLTHLPIPLVDTRSGAYLNLLVLLAFYILVISFFDRWMAVARNR